ncbi:FmdE family protein [Desulfocurvus sp.]|jgi:formylmethanofuran dehydrogenase subunit E|uniref:FmdE family protein n=1 Tax=Desulfocurvus sp. TaxID=2871698 RepID=UPI0025BED1FF|nr:FmdE family protein [Desulfocurvus sp.]MCK9239446.1 FmdE family protein [Desulfocurvus sp.]
MTHSALTREQIDRAIDFHGHQCPGLAIGLRAAELCLREFGHNNDVPITAVVETDMCGVDAIQALTGCTVGKGNFIQRDHGKMAFTFYRHADGKGLRALLRPSARPMRPEASELQRKVNEGNASPEDRARLQALRAEAMRTLLELPLEEVFEVQPPATPIPRGPSILESLACADCGELTMESRTRRLEGRTLCIPCFEKRDQKR